MLFSFQCFSELSWKDTWWAIIALLISTGISLYSLIMVARTAKNVQRVSGTSQLAQLRDLIRHLYRNLIVTIAFYEKFNNENDSSQEGHSRYPSESHLLKLKVDSNDFIHMEKYNSVNDKNDDINSRMHEVKLLLRNYDTEIDVALEHMKNKNMSCDVINDDMGNLLFKPFYLTSYILKLMHMIIRAEKLDKGFVSRKIMITPEDDAINLILTNHLIKLNENISNYIVGCHWKSDLDFGKELPNSVSRSLKMLETGITLKTTREDALKYYSRTHRSVDKELSDTMDRISENFNDLLNSTYVNENPQYWMFLTKDEWGVEDYPVIIKTDVAIEYGKIHMITCR